MTKGELASINYGIADLLDAETIKNSIPEDQAILVHKYVYKIEWDTINNLISIFVKVDAPHTAISSDLIILEKTLYTKYIV